MPEYDLLIRGGTIVDGLKVPKYQGDIGIRNGKIAAISGKVHGSAAKTIDAGGLIVAPGVLDLHTHYDAQLKWDPYASPSAFHGVTSVMIANCGFGFAPCHPEERDLAMQRMSRVEAISLSAMREGVKWDWETFPEFLDSLDRQGLGVNAAAYFPTSPLRSYVLGFQEARERTKATPSEIEQMKALFREGMKAGAFGFSVDRSPVNRDYDGAPLPSHIADPAEFMALAEVQAEFGRGSIGWAWETQTNFCGEPYLAELSRVSGCPVQVVVVSYNHQNPGLMDEQLTWLEEVNKTSRVYGQTHCMPVMIQFMMANLNLFDEMPAWNKACTGSVEEKVLKFQNPELRAEMQHNLDHCEGTLFYKLNWEKVLVVRTKKPENQKFDNRSVADMAREVGKTPLNAMLDLSLAEGLQTEFIVGELLNDDEAAMRRLLMHPYVHFSDSDAGAHNQYLMIGPWPTYFLSHWVREKQLTSLEDAHWRMSHLPASIAGIKDRGYLAEGMAADIIVYDFDNLKVSPEVPEMAYDLPGGEWRLVQGAEGYQAVVVNGQTTMENGKPTGTLSGRMLRSTDRI